MTLSALRLRARSSAITALLAINVLIMAACGADVASPPARASAAESMGTPMANATVPAAADGPEISGSPQEASDETALPHLTLRSSQDRYRAGQLIEIEATLEHRDTSTATYRAYGSSSGLLGFAIESADGTVKTDLVGTADCGEHLLRAKQRFAFIKSGGWSDESPPFIRSYFASPHRELRLPAGNWTVSAHVHLHLAEGCRDPETILTAPIAITVVP
jgi:hypothetical protein